MSTNPPEHSRFDSSEPLVSAPAPETGSSPEAAPPPPRSGKRDLAIIAVIVIVVAVMIWSAVHFSRSGRQAAIAPGGSLVGKPAPGFELTTLDGKTAKLADYHGKAVLLNFWATYCGPCRIEMPWFVDLQNKYAAQGLQIIGIDDEDATKQTVKDYIDQVGTNYPILLGKDAVADAYGVEGLPTTFFIDRDGKVVDQTLGLASKKELEDRIQRAIATSSSSAASGGATAVADSSIAGSILEQKKQAAHKALAWIHGK